jgi:hypothetical protein
MMQNILYSNDPVGILTIGLYYVEKEPEFTSYYTSSDLNVGIVTASSLTVGVATVGIASTSNLTENSTLTFELTSNTNLRVRVRGTDGVIRSANLTLS